MWRSVARNPQNLDHGDRTGNLTGPGRTFALVLVRDATLANGQVVDVRTDGSKIDAIGSQLTTSDDHVIDAQGKLLLPGAIDVHVHFREPGYTWKESWATGSRSAAAGGVTTVIDQPNTEPPTITGASFTKKANHAASSLIDYGINGGITPDWQPDSLFQRPIFAIGEVFLADSTGEMGIEMDLFQTGIQRAAEANLPVTVHAEAEERFDHSAKASDAAMAWSKYRPPAAEITAIQKACEVATAVSENQLHIAHTSTPEGVKQTIGKATCEATPHHLLLSRDDLEELGSFGRMNPPLRTEASRRELFRLLVDGTIDVVASDHAPHTRAEKETNIWDAPSGVPGVETMLPLLLSKAADGRIGYERIVEVTARNPATIFDLPLKGQIATGADADLIMVDPDTSQSICADNLHSKCDWTPFEGWDGIFPEWTAVRGEIVFCKPDGNVPQALSPAGKFGDPVGDNVRG